MGPIGSGVMKTEVGYRGEAVVGGRRDGWRGHDTDDEGGDNFTALISNRKPHWAGKMPEGQIKCKTPQC